MRHTVWIIEYRPVGCRKWYDHEDHLMVFADRKKAEETARRRHKKYSDSEYRAVPFVRRQP